MGCLRTEYEGEFEFRHWESKSISIRHIHLPYAIVILTPYSRTLNKWKLTTNFHEEFAWVPFDVTLNGGRKKAKELLYERYLKEKEN